MAVPKKWNTHQLLEAALEHAQSQGHEVELIHIYDYPANGCKSCLDCKLINAPKPARCVLRNEYTPLLTKVLQADVALFGSPIYFGGMSAQMQAFMERLWFPSLNYNCEWTVNYDRHLICGLVFTMNGTADFYS